MLASILTVIFATAVLSSDGTDFWKSNDDGSISQNILSHSYSDRSGKFFPLFSVVRFPNTQCSANNNFNGTCFTRRECSNYGGTACGTCANGLGVCCVFQKTCGSTTNMNNTYFTNPEYPITYPGGDRCTISVYRCNSNICQLRLDFLDSSLEQPNTNGTCDVDFLLVTGGSSFVPRICGENTNQHVYVDFNGANPITISVDANAENAFNRRWNVRIQQIACDSLWRAPNGCLQYQKGVTGTVTSFNYGTTVNRRAPLMGTREMANLNYGVCVRMALGYCSIEWSQADSQSFTVSDNTEIVDPTLIGTEIAAVAGSNCTKDFVIVPKPTQNGTALPEDRFCGNAFLTKSTNLKPFVLYVVTDGDEVQEIQNRGFVLNYRQIPCAV